MSRSVLFIQTAFLGDVVLATAALEAWHAAHPEDKVDVCKPMDGLRGSGRCCQDKRPQVKGISGARS